MPQSRRIYRGLIWSKIELFVIGLCVFAIASMVRAPGAYGPYQSTLGAATLNFAPNRRANRRDHKRQAHVPFC